MSLLFFTSLTLALAMSAPIMAQPITLGVNLLILTLVTAAMIAYSASSWLGYIVFLIYIGGVLVMFAYVAALTPNLMFSLKRLYIFPLTILSTTLILSLFLPNKMTNSNLSMASPAQLIDATGASLFSTANVSILIFLGCILLLALIAVVKVCHFYGGPLRPFK